MLNRVLSLAYGLGVVAVFAMAIITGVDVVGRYLFNRPLIGANEIIEILMGILFACGIAVTSASDDHISVDSIYDKLSPGGKRLLRIFASTMITVIFVILVWQGFQGGIIGFKSGKVSDTLDIPLFPFKFFLAFGFLVSLIFTVRQLVDLLRGKKPS